MGQRVVLRLLTFWAGWLSVCSVALVPSTSYGKPKTCAEKLESSEDERKELKQSLKEANKAVASLTTERNNCQAERAALTESLSNLGDQHEEAKAQVDKLLQEQEDRRTAAEKEEERLKRQPDAEAVLSHLVVEIDGSSPRPGEQATLHRNTCRLTAMAPTAADGTRQSLRGAGITSIALVGESDTSVLPISAVSLSDEGLRPNEADLCSGALADAPNATKLRLLVSFVHGGETRAVEYPIKYSRDVHEWRIGAATYVGSTLGDGSSQTVAVGPSLVFGSRWNLPIKGQDSDFFLGVNLVVGGGLFYSTAEGQAGPGMFTGLSVDVGRWLSVGAVYDPIGDRAIWIVAPGELFKASVGF